MPALKHAFDACSPQAANDASEFVNVLSTKSSEVPRPAAAWRRAIRCRHEDSEMLSDRAAGMLQEIAKVTYNGRADCRRAVFGRRLFAFQFQNWFLGAAHKLRDILAPLQPSGPNAVERWLGEPLEGKWPFPLSRRGCKSNVSVGHDSAAIQSWRPNAGCP